MSLDDDALAELRELEAAGRLRTPRVRDGAPGPIAILDGVEVLNLGSNDYLGLAGDRRLAEAARAVLDDAGVGATASRLIVGNHRAHVALEDAVADWMRVRSGGVRLFGSGYAANVGVISALVRAGDVVFSDELNHASIIDGCRLARAEVVVFAHRDLGALERGLARAGGHRRRLVVSESLFSMDGDHADLAGLAGLCARHDAALILDEAHAIGAVGPEGRGLAAAAGVVPDVLIGAFGKAMGTFGAFAATTPAIAALLWNRARSLVFSTAIPPAIAAASLAAVAIVRGGEGEQRRRTLAANARRFRARVARAGGAPDSAIVPVLIGDDRRAMAVAARLLAADRVFAQGIRPPTVPVGAARLRVGLTAALTESQIDRAAVSIDNALRQEVL